MPRTPRAAREDRDFMSSDEESDTTGVVREVTTDDTDELLSLIGEEIEEAKKTEKHEASTRKTPESQKRDTKRLKLDEDSTSTLTTKSSHTQSLLERVEKIENGIQNDPKK